jgi:phenylacetic acid degradation operon negative regulatory protein
MTKLLRIQDQILLGAALLGDTFEEVKDPAGLISYRYKLLYGWVPPRLRRHNFYRAVQRLLKTGNIERVNKEGGPYIRLTNQGIRKITRDFPLFSLARKKWDRRWTVIIFDIKETVRWVRDLFRSQIVRLGCGKLQRSVYITPHNITQELKEMITFQGLEGTVRVFRTPLLFEKDEKELTNRVWKLENLNDRYQSLLTEWRENKENLKGEKKEKFIRKLKTSYLNVLANDPILPKDLLLNDWVGERAHQLIPFLK